MTILNHSQIGRLRRFLFVNHDSWWNAFVRDWTAKLGLVVLAFVALALPGMAQNLYEVGASFDPGTTPRFKGSASILVPLDSTASTYSYSSFLVNKPVQGVFMHSEISGIRRKAPVAPVLGFTLWADLQGGVAASPSAVSGAFIGGAAETRQIRRRIGLTLGQKVYVIPASGGAQFQFTAALQITP